MNGVRAIVVVVSVVLVWAFTQDAQAQKPIRIGATLTQTGLGATSGQGYLRGYQLCVKHMNEKAGVLGRPLELFVHDDRGDPAMAARLYEQLITQDKVDLVLGPYSSRIIDAVADVTERRKLPMVSPGGAGTRGRRFVFSLISPTHVFLEGLLDLGAKRGLKTVALASVDDLGGRSMRQGAVELARKKGLQVVFDATYRLGTTDFSAILTKVRAANADVLAVATVAFDDGVTITRQMKALDVNPRMVGFAPAVNPATLHDAVGRDADFVYAATSWMPELVEIRAGGLIPISREYPGAREFVEAARREFPGQFPPAHGYGACQVLVEGVRRAGSLDGTKVRDAISAMDYHTVYGRFRVDQDGFQIGHKMLLIQLQDGKLAIVWPEELAPSQPRVPTPPWNQRP